MKSVPFVVYWSRVYLLAVLLLRKSKPIRMRRKPTVLVVKRTPCDLLPTPWAGQPVIRQLLLSATESEEPFDAVKDSVTRPTTAAVAEPRAGVRVPVFKLLSGD